MSLPRKIDLTANGDFGGNRFNHTLAFPIEIERELVTKEMTNEEYDELIKWGKIFGRRKWHKNQKNKIFDPEIKFNKYWENTCYRCGKTIREPWSNIGGICKNCNDHLEKTSSNKIPWKKKTFDNVNMRRDLFELR